MSIYDKILQKVKDEISKDPRKLGYNGKTVKEQLNILNTTYAIVVSSEVVMPCPANQILAGIESAPNAIDETLITAAKLYIGGS